MINCSHVEILAGSVVKPEIDSVHTSKNIKDASIESLIAGTDAEIAVIHWIVYKIPGDIGGSSIYRKVDVLSVVDVVKAIVGGNCHSLQSFCKTRGIDLAGRPSSGEVSGSYIKRTSSIVEDENNSVYARISIEYCSIEINESVAEITAVGRISDINCRRGEIEDSEII